MSLHPKILDEIPAQGIFCTGIENSDPWVNGVRRDQLTEAFDFYSHYETRIRNIHALGLRWLRFGPCYSQTHRGKDTFDFSFCDKVMELCRTLNITVLADLLHFGLPRWLHEEDPSKSFFQNPHFPEHFASYARAFAKRYPRTQFFTCVNEPYVTAFFCAKIGIWNEQIRSEWNDDVAFVNAAKNICKAVLLAREAILTVWTQEQRPFHPVFLQNESFELATYTHESRIAEVTLFNTRRFVMLDLIFGKRDDAVNAFLMGAGMSAEEYEWFMQHGSREHAILGIDHYPTCVHMYGLDGVVHCDPTHSSQFLTLVKEYYARYQVPLLHTEVNAWPDHALTMCQQTYDAIEALRKDGFPILGMAWYGDEYQVGWHQALVGNYDENHVGLFYRGTLQPVGKLFGELAQKGFSSIKL
ncbi:MAG TPA: family 1 glycosylhydrolase [Acidobacteriota bacterium]|nr:family 1 glycosylhydrolase [Acidobacteriota bacterium]